MAAAIITYALWVVPAAWALYKILTFGSREKGLPPGPPTIPVLGNAHMIPLKGLHLKFKEWAQKYGSVYSLKVGRGTLVVLCDREAVFELLSRQGAHYNSRPPDQQVNAALGDENIAFMYEGPRWRAQRKIIATYYSPKNLDSTLQPVLVAEISHLMNDILANPENFRDSVKRTTASISTDTVFGHHAPDCDSYWAKAAYLSIDQAIDVIAPGTYLPVDQLPILKLLPDRLNGPFREAKKRFPIICDIWAKAREQVEERRRHGDRRESLIDNILDENLDLGAPHTYSELNNFFGAIQMASADTTSGHTLASILFLSQHPDVQAKAQEELDRVCGTERMPAWSDFEKLPYVNCIIKEGLRMRAALPTGIAHLARKDTWYKGMFIPQGSSIIVPPTAINNDRYASGDPAEYNPDRFLPVAGKLAPELSSSPRWQERDHYSYGVGRRICPGMHLAERIQWRIMAQLLWAFKIEPEGELSTGYDMFEEAFLHYVKEFKVRFVPRSEKHAEMVRAQFKDNEEFLKRFG